MNIAITLFIPQATGTQIQQRQVEADRISSLELYHRGERIIFTVSFHEYTGGYFASGTRLVGYIGTPHSFEVACALTIKDSLNSILGTRDHSITWHMTTLL